jgi:hypothetical protein
MSSLIVMCVAGAMLSAQAAGRLRVATIVSARSFGTAGDTCNQKVCETFE